MRYKKIKIKTIILIVIFSVLYFGCGKPGEPMPNAIEIIGKYFEAKGSASIDKIENMKFEYAVKTSMSPVESPMTFYYGKGKKIYREMFMMGKYENGYDGSIVWEVSPMMPQGVIIRDKEKASKIIDLLLGGYDFLNFYGDLFNDAQTTGTENVEGEKCYKIMSKPVDGVTFDAFIAVDGYKMMKTIFDFVTPMGSAKYEWIASDYKDVNGLQIPQTFKTVYMGQPFSTITLKKMEVNTSLPKDRFDAPASIKAQMK